MRILLINPPETRLAIHKTRMGTAPPLGLAYIAAYIRQHNSFTDCHVKILDCMAIARGWQPLQHRPDQLHYGLGDISIINYIDMARPDIVGITCPFPSREYNTLHMCKMVKSIYLNTIVVVGGAHPSCCPDSFAASQYVDHVVIGEGEIPMLQLSKGVSLPAIITSAASLPLDTLPMPARDLLHMPYYLYSDSPHSGYKHKPYTTMITSRGCPNSCGFCAIRQIYGPGVRFRSVESIIDEINYLHVTYDIREIHFEDDCLTANPKRAKRLMQAIINLPYKLSLASPSGLAVNTLDDELLTLMHAAGYYSISLAIESGVQRVLDLMHKPVPLSKVPALVSKIRQMGMVCKGFFILGYPGETLAEMAATIRFAQSLHLDWSIWFPCTPIPGTPLAKHCIDMGYITDDNHNQDDSVSIKNYFQDAQIHTDDFTPEDVSAIREHANYTCNFANNTNYIEGNYQRAIDDWEQVLTHYPHMEGKIKPYIKKARLLQALDKKKAHHEL